MVHASMSTDVDLEGINRYTVVDSVLLYNNKKWKKWMASVRESDRGKGAER